MIKKKFLLIFLLIVGTALPAFGFLIARPVYHDPGKVIQVSETRPNFIISLPANPTTGYQWKVIQYDSKVLALTETQFIPFPTQRLGAGGFSRWIFEVNSGLLDSHMPFETSITLKYSRAWAPQDHPKTVVFTVMSSNNLVEKMYGK